MKPLLILLLIFLTALTVTLVSAQTGYELTWDAIVSGGGVSTGGPYTLADTAGQPAVGASGGGPYTLVDGFQASAGGFIPPPTPTPTPGSPGSQRIYLPSILK